MGYGPEGLGLWNGVLGFGYGELGFSRQVVEPPTCGF